MAEKHPVPAVRAAAVKTVVVTQDDNPNTIDWLMKRVSEDDDWEPRSIATWAVMLLGGADGRALPWMRDLALHDQDPMVRSEAIESWAFGWATRSEERADLASIGSNDPRPDVRVAAIRALSGAFPGNRDVTSWLDGLAGDTDPAVRRAAERELLGRGVLPRIPNL
ncbi:HEAT repeat domain-containing protein [Lentzea terrae]|uniref:HEAT repeat domain-containing protein n=1 Tax=Lentzea terrae TaxID=2200761 RepID=UPI0018E583CB|nr:HEAT repeat domain-containing protein [Lentzea terrae]